MSDKKDAKDFLKAIIAAPIDPSIAVDEKESIENLDHKKMLAEAIQYAKSCYPPLNNMTKFMIEEGPPGATLIGTMFACYIVQHYGLEGLKKHIQWITQDKVDASKM